MKFDHIGIKCTDLEASVKYYTEVLGFEKTYEVEVMGKPCVFVARGGLEIELESIGAAGDAPVAPPNVGLTHFAFETDDIDGLAKEFLDNGAEFMIPPFQIRPSRKTGFVKAPDGVLIQLIQNFPDAE